MKTSAITFPAAAAASAVPPPRITAPPAKNVDSMGSMIPAAAIPEMLSKMTIYFGSMVDTKVKKNRFYYRCLPSSNKHVHGHCPIRDLGSAWDATNLLGYWKEQRQNEYYVMDAKVFRCLEAAVVTTMESYQFWDEFRDGQGRPCRAIRSSILQEPSNIAHSAFFLLATVGALELGLLPLSKNHSTEGADELETMIEQLVHGILSMQQRNGAFRIVYGDANIFRGIEFYPGEAMLSLMAVYEHDYLVDAATKKEILSALRLGFSFYKDYFHNDYVTDDFLSFFGNWQVQCFSKLYFVTRDAQVADYVLELCDAIAESHPWKILERQHYTKLSTVEIACGLEALADGTQVALSAGDTVRAKTYLRHAHQATAFLSAVQNEVSPDSTGYGGLNHRMKLAEQRLDVTGHAVNALIKVSKLQQQIQKSHCD